MSICMSIGCEKVAQLHQDFCEDCIEQQKIQKENIEQHTPGAKADKGKVRMHLITGGMARAITEVAKVGTFGANKYSDGGWVFVPDGFNRYEDAQQRHAALRHMNEEFDSESGLLHLSHEAWNALAKLDLYLREIQE